MSREVSYPDQSWYEIVNELGGMSMRCASCNLDMVPYSLESTPSLSSAQETGKYGDQTEEREGLG